MRKGSRILTGFAVLACVLLAAVVASAAQGAGVEIAMDAPDTVDFGPDGMVRFTAEPSTVYDIDDRTTEIEYLDEGAEVRALACEQQGGGWCEISEPVSGFIWGGDLEPLTDDVVFDDEPLKPYVATVLKRTQVMSDADLSSTRRGPLTKGTKVKYIDCDRGWCHVTAPLIGFVVESALRR